MTQPSDRSAWAAQLVGARPGERVLEIGPGHGVLLHLLADAGAVVTGLDRSPTMIAAAAGRCGPAATLLTGRIQDLTTDTVFDAVVAARVREIWTDPASLPVVQRVLAPGGRLVLVLDAPSGSVPASTVDAVRDALAAGGFAVDDERRHRGLVGLVAAVRHPARP